MAKKTTGTTTKINESVLAFRSQLARWLGYSHNGQRDLYSAFGYPREVGVQELYAKYMRNDIANRIVRAFPNATWRDAPLIRDEKGESAEAGTKSYSPFVEAVENLFDKHKILRQLERVDRMSGIGRFGVLFMGFKDGLRPDQPLAQGKHELMFLQPYSELTVTISSWDSDPTSPRFGMPERYTLGAASSMILGGSAPTNSITAHYSRVIHISEFLDQDNVYGTPRLLPIYNRLMDLEKVVGGAAETFWLAADRGIALWADKEAEFNEDDREKMKVQAQELQDKLRRVIVGQGMTAQVLGSESPDPEPNATILIDLISGATGIPKRILLGTERGELSSAQDENNWAARTDERRRNYATPTLLVPLVTILVATGNLPEPEGVWWIEWPEVSTQDPVAESTVMLNKTNALVAYSNAPNAELVVPMQEFRRDFLNIDPESEYEIEYPEEIDEEAPEIVPEFTDEEVPEETLDEGLDEDLAAAQESNTNSAPMSLYVRRDVKNVGAFKRWARSQGLTIEDDLHVTIMYCKEPIYWEKVGHQADVEAEEEDNSLMIHPDTARSLSRFGIENNKLVLEFSSDILKWRHIHMKEMGAVHSFPEYRPHITLCDVAPDFDISGLEAYLGAIALGPEIFEETKED